MKRSVIKILFIGDIIGRPGRAAVKKLLPNLVKKNDLDFVIANGENLASGKGMTKKTYDEMIEIGVDLFTSGNHIWNNKDIIPFLDDSSVKILRPLNYPKGTPGRGATVLEKGDKKLFVINLQGRVFMPDEVEDPFSLAMQYSQTAKDPILIDFHAEATSEKIAFGNYLDGRVAAVIGTHTHVQTADEKIFAGGSGFITDAGMTGPIDSVLGVEKEIIIERFLTSLPVSHKVAVGAVNFSAVLVVIDPERKITTAISRLNETVDLD